MSHATKVGQGALGGASALLLQIATRIAKIPRIIKEIRVAKQSASDRRRRLLAGCCPVHGMGMGQVGVWSQNGVKGSLVECFRKDCQVQAIQERNDGPLQLTPRYRHLMAPIAA
jgi:hypothetical protein